MIVIPAIDLMGGKVVRLSRGDPLTRRSYEQFGDPVETARSWELQGASRLHVIDLDAAFGRSNNHEVISRIMKAVGIPTQVGGGIRSLKSAKEALDGGVSEVILGSMAIREPLNVNRLMEEYGPERIIVSLDHLEGKIRIKGWTEDTRLDLEKTLNKFASNGVKKFLVTSIDRDGTLSGPNYTTLTRVVSKGRIIAAGGIGSLQDLSDLKKIGVSAAVVGKALYDGRFTLAEALRLEAS
jgi:phosphoribosylformimino-5-aminoimidazole carboxamide ribotide isomerase